VKSTPFPSRRRLLSGLSTVLVAGALAGCSDRSSPNDESEPGNNDTTSSETPDSDNDATSGSEGGSGADLDLREANVVSVDFDRESNEYTFDVELHHDDAGEDGFANWWQVERLDGTRIGRRELAHAHDQQPFTRSETIDVPDDVTCVVVRGHDQTHEYGGQLMLVNLETTATRAVDQGPEPQTVNESDCP